MGVPLAIALRYDGAIVDDARRLKYADDQPRAHSALVERAQEGDYEAFEGLVREFRNDVFSLCYYLVRNREDAWDLSQEAFVKAHRSIKRFRGDASFKTWLLRIASNHCKDFFKKRKLRTIPLESDTGQFDPPSTKPDPSENLEAKELGAAIQKAVDTLSEKHRTAFILREFEGLSYEEMAQTMGCTRGTVMSRLHHARKNLQKILRSMGVVEGPKNDDM